MDQIFQVHLQIGDIITNYFHKPWVSFANTFKTFNFFYDSLKLRFGDYEIFVSTWIVWVSNLFG